MGEREQAIEDLRVIRRMIDETRRATGAQWAYYLLWGSLGAVASSVCEILIRTEEYATIPFVWQVYLVLGLVGSMVIERTQAKGKRIRTVYGRVQKVIGLAIAVNIAILNLTAFLFGAPPPFQLGAIIAFVVAMGILISAALVQLPVLYGIAALWWVAGFVMVAWPAGTFMTLVPVFVLGFILPAWWLRQKTREGAADEPATP